MLADDLTGACDAAAPFAVHGLRTWVAWDAANFGEPGAELVSACTNSRPDDAKLAADKTRHAARCLWTLGATRVFKKIDSTLKGNWVPEMLAILDELRLKAAVIAPAFPAMGRRIIDGQLHLSGEPYVDPPSLLTNLRDQCPTSTYHVSLRELRKGPINLVNLIVQSRGEERLFVVDGDLDADLDIVAESVELLGESVLPTGSGGLGASIARRANSASHAPATSVNQSKLAPAAACPDWTPRPIMVFVGSSNPRTQSQVKVLMESRTACEIELEDTTSWRIAECLKSGIHVVVHVRWGEKSADAMDHLLEACQCGDVNGLVLTGGDTAQFVCGRCDTRGIWMEGEILRGMPWGRFSGGPFDGVHVATKAGGFGGPDSLSRSVGFLENTAIRRTPTSSADHRSPY
ncbi:MAG: four-carbon acid sugar kinase family protein [Pirellulales bacterium]